MKKIGGGFLVGLLVGAASVHFYSGYVTEKQFASVLFSQNLYKAQAASRTLRLMDEQRLDTVRKMAQINLDNAVDTSYRLMVSEQPELGIEAPNLMRGLIEAEEYLTARDPDARTALWLRDVIAYVLKASEKYGKDAG